MKEYAGYAMCFAGGNMISNGLLLAGIALMIAGFFHIIAREPKNA